ncbi:bifunctional UDP-N-acetylglucosamine diphosphorylase/glucosamine-1-phosphate N-acetyltransferase GlmU [Roseospira visakhapatnamensis]|uniref:Bifunctional protein GlmU n=1 Tax=Roseospira visakhapatnamensis TaxID=390880 RepID=A0A7W6WAD4_9PROT|nr:bifunctional UDP-N-acetylglucosamine diphosphorylase/glucosamine-1-phosphate N-acetyltransferase GlmU [Roseospira visakhapatnamensis]MBB4266376.1 bifunctional UDP-N-acetylglucosamine pyrophosphorylase/glucosamine-1-phosphate N-acetyltransferase [Roseospira visakhapatnamensis]
MNAQTPAATDVAAIVLAAGMGTRMRSTRPKVAHVLAGRPLLGHVLDTLDMLGAPPEATVVVAGPHMPEVERLAAPRPTVLQAERLGTAHAALQARPALPTPPATVLILFGDSPLVRVETLRAMVARRGEGADVVVLGFQAADPTGYGRLVTDGRGALEAIVEHKDATEDQRAITLCNAGVMAVDGARLFGLLERIGNANAKGEHYLTDIVALARADGLVCAVVEGDEAEMLGINDRAQLATAERVVQGRLRRAAMEGGATLTDPDTVFLSMDTRLGRDVTVGPFCVFGPGVTIGDGVEIKGFCHFEGCTVEAGATLGPYARLRPGATIAQGAHIGNFVEIKKATVEPGAKVNHLTYIGDARVGAAANVGAGTITCNYDGFAKHHTDIGAGAFIGSNTALVAPVRVGDGAIVGAGSTITHDVPADALAVTRAALTQRDGWAAKFRAHMKRLTGKG